MDDTFLLSGLLSKRAELIGKIEHCHKEIAKLNTAVNHLEATLRLIAPELDLSTQKPKEYRPRQSPFRNGEVPVLILNLLRERQAPMATNEIAYTLAAQRNLPTDKNYARVVKPIHSALQRLRRNGVIEPIGKIPGAGGGSILWQIL